MQQTEADALYECDRCHADIDAGQRIYDCSLCDYSLCPSCHTSTLALLETLAPVSEQLFVAGRAPSGEGRLPPPVAR